MGSIIGPYVILAHEMGHNFGFLHDDSGKDKFSENSVGGVDSAGSDGGSVVVLMVHTLTVMIVVFMLVV